MNCEMSCLITKRQSLLPQHGLGDCWFNSKNFVQHATYMKSFADSGGTEKYSYFLVKMLTTIIYKNTIYYEGK